MRCFAIFGSLALSFSAFAQAPQLALPSNSDLVITGSVGTVYAVLYTTNLADPTAWRCLNLQLQAATASSAPNTAPASSGTRFYQVASVAPSNMVFVAPGTFTLGSPDSEVDRFSDEGPQTTVTFTKGIFVGMKMVSQQEYLSVTGKNPSVFTGDLTRPVDTVSWQDATNYCALLTQRERVAKHIPPGCVYRLPTEAEWENACRAGTTNRFNYGDDPGYTNLADHAWYTVNSTNQTHPGGLKPANGWGLFDMHGNLWEWCNDWYGPYPGGSVTDPAGADPNVDGRVIRGGSWADEDLFCRAACRLFDDPGSAFMSYGFRVVLAPGN
jgi:formylglycine-generating enzyme required for sulfatase activity